MKLSPNLQGAALMAVSMAAFVLNDTALKFAGVQIGVFQILFVRGIFAVILLGILTARVGAFRRLPDGKSLRLIGVRTLAEIGATLAFLTALFHLPLANITAILQLTPLGIALAAAVFLKERVNAPQALAIAAGFCGVLIIIRPGAADFNGYFLIGLIVVAFAVVRDLSVRRIKSDVSSLFVAFAATMGILIAGAAGVVFTQSWVPLALWEVGLLAASAVFIVVGYYGIVAAMRVGDIAFVSSFRYSILVWAIVSGWLVFGDVPDFWALVGMLVIFGAGLFMSAAEWKNIKREPR